MRATMLDQDLFNAQVDRLWRRARADMPGWYRSRSRDAEIAYGYRLYAHSAAARLTMLVLGEQDIRRDVALLKNFGVTAVTATLSVPGDRDASRQIGAAAAADADLFAHGSVLNERFWWPFFNDCWVLGGVHAGASFHLAMGARPETDALWDAARGRPRVLGRELIGLHTAGYRRVDHDHEGTLGIVFAPADRGVAAATTFAQLFDAYDQPWSAAQILAIFDHEPLAYDRATGAVIRPHERSEA